MLDERWIRSLHVETLREEELHAGREPHVLFQASTIGALLEGAYDGDLSFAELAEHGDLGLGTLNGLDGEMIALDGELLPRRRRRPGRAGSPAAARTPFAVVTEFEPAIDATIDGGARPRRAAGPARRADPGRRRLLRDPPRRALRAGPRPLGARASSPPYRPLTEVVAEQHVFELRDVAGTMLGFRFPDYAEGIEVSGYHLHFISDDRSAAATCSARAASGLRVRLDPSNDLHVELPPGVELADPDLAAATHAAVERVERGS